MNYPEKCPHCGKDLALNTNRKSTTDENIFYEIVHCYHCQKAILFVINPYTQEILHTYPAKAFVSLQQEIKDLSPTACEIFEQTMQAKAAGLFHLVGPGIRMSLEWLIWDYLIKIKNIPETELKNKSLYSRLSYLKDDNYKLICANIIRVFGNDEIHLFKDFNIDTDDAIKILKALFDNIYAELLIKKVNEKLS